MKKRATVLFLLALLALPGLPAAAQDPADVVNCIVAVVDGSPVTLVDVMVVIRFELGDRAVVSGGDPKVGAAWALIDRRLVTRKLEGQWAPEQAEIEAALKDLKTALGPGRFAEGLAAFDLEEKDLLPYVREKMVYERILAARFSRSALVSRGDIERYYREVLVPERKRQGKQPEPQVEAEKEIIGRLQDDARRKQADEWIQGLREQAAVRLNLDCLK